MRSIALMVLATALFTIGCATSAEGPVLSTVSGTNAFEIYASTEEATNAARLVVERLGLSVLHDDSETRSLQVGSSDGMALFRVSIEPNDRQVRVVTSYYREAPGSNMDLGDDAESLSQQIREINDEIRTVLENLPPVRF